MRWIGLLAMLAATGASGQTVVDNTAQNVPPDKLKDILDLVSDKFKDPISTQFRRLRTVDYHSVPNYCGEVNAKNSYGAYTGFQLFITPGKRVALLLPPPSDPYYKAMLMSFEVCFSKDK